MVLDNIQNADDGNGEPMRFISTFHSGLIDIQSVQLPSCIENVKLSELFAYFNNLKNIKVRQQSEMSNLLFFKSLHSGLINLQH